MPSSKSKTVDIRVDVPVRAKPERVYRALTSARELCLWWCDRAETEARNMGRFRVVWPGSGRGGKGGEAHGVFVDLEPHSKVAWIWDRRSRPNGVPALISYFIEKVPRGSRVTIVHAGFSATPAGRKTGQRLRESWEDCLAKLKLYLESGKVCKNDRLTLQEAQLLRRAGRR